MVEVDKNANGHQQSDGVEPIAEISVGKQKNI